MYHRRKFIISLIVISFSISASTLISAQNSSVERSGDYLQYALPITAGLSSLVYKNDDQAGLQFAAAFSSAMLITHSMKRILNKQRPDGGKHAFPSGHSTAAFVSAGFFHKRYGWKIGLPTYILAAYVGWTRVDANRHDWWDVAAGAAIGIAASRVFTRQYVIMDKELEITLGTGTVNVELRF